MFTYEIDEELYLRTFTLADAEEFYHLTITSKTYLKEWLGWLDNIQTVKDTAENIQSRLNELHENDGRPRTFAIIYQEKIVGTIGYSKMDRKNKVGTVGYWLGEKYQGKGIMTKAFQALIHYGFQDLSLNRIEVRAATENVKSRSLPEHFSFQEEGIIREAEWLYNHYVDHVVYGLLVNEWEASVKN